MPRPACISLPELPLQLLFRHRPEWKELPAAVVEANRPLARITALNRPAGAVGIRRGMRYATALSLASDLRADVISGEQLDAARQEVRNVIADFSPTVEDCNFDAEIFWADTGGMLSLFDSRQTWAARLKDTLAESGFHANIAVGFSRFGTFAWAKRRKAVRVFASAQEEQRTALETPLSLFPFPPRVLELTESLGLSTIGELTQLPTGEIRRKLGKDAFEIYRFATEAETLPLQGRAPGEDPSVSLSPLAPIKSTAMLENAISRLLEDLLARLEGSTEGIRELIIVLRFENTSSHTERITPARPTKNTDVLMRLVHLRLEHLTPADGVIGITLDAERVEMSYRQEELFAAEAGTTLGAGEEATAGLRAELGNRTVAKAELFSEYLPEEQFRFMPTTEPGLPAGGNAGGGPPTLVRRIRRNPLRIPRPRAGELRGPYVVSGHWWRSKATNRGYHYLHLPDGRTLWVYYDAEAGSWYVHGSVD